MQASKKKCVLDSFSLKINNTKSLADALNEQSTIHIKAYGNGNLATTSLRGGNANHTALLWNGINIQNPLLGQTDLSIVPIYFFDNVSVEYGGGSAMWGSGAIGGSILLQNKTMFNKGLQTKLQISTGSFNNKKINALLLLSYKKVVSQTKIYYTKCENNYTYKDTTDKLKPNKQISHANYISKGVMQELSFLMPHNQKINARLWYNNTDRNLPSYSTEKSTKNQFDENLKFNADWNFNKNNFNAIVRLGMFNDKLNFTDSLAYIFSNSTVHTIITESDNNYTLKNHKLNFGINNTNYTTTFVDRLIKNNTLPAHDTTIENKLNKTAIFLAYQLTLLNNKLLVNASARKEFLRETNIPFTGNAGIFYQVLKQINLTINVNKTYRQPTLNDLYWPYGGNKNLKPETSYEIDAGLEFKKTKNNWLLIANANYYNRKTNNWIIWLPSNSSINWSPINILKVHSRGTETHTELTYHKKSFFTKIILNTAYTLSTNKAISGANDNSLNRQLIYTPRYNGNATLALGYKKINFLINQTYTGYRFIASDNTAWLYPYYLTNLKINYAFTTKQTTVNLFASVSNALNKNYQVVSNAPMPMRNYEIGIAINYNTIIKNKKPNN